MAKTKKARKVRQRIQEKAAPPEVKALPDARDTDGTTDYGGLPARDLKKNLGGCG